MIPKTRAEMRAFLRSTDGKAALAKLLHRKGTTDAAGKVRETDSMDYGALAEMAQAGMKDKIGAILLHGIVNMAAEESEIAAGGEEPLIDAPPPMAPAMMEKQMDAAIARHLSPLKAEAMKQMDAAIARHLSPLKAELDALRAEKTARDAQASAQGDAALRKLAADLGVKDAATVAIDAIVVPMAARLGISVDGLDAAAARTVVTSTARLKAAQPAPRLSTNDSGTGPVYQPRSSGVN